MGASGWSYRTPFQEDVAAALQVVRWSVFESGDYYREDSVVDADLTEPEWIAKYGDENGDVDELELSAWRAGRTVVVDPDTAATSQPYSGTHTILDITEGVSAAPAMCTVSPLTDGQLMLLFGTLTPTSAQGWEQSEAICDYREQWQGAYVIAYEDDKPTEIQFHGISGD